MRQEATLSSPTTYKITTPDLSYNEKKKNACPSQPGRAELESTIRTCASEIGLQEDEKNRE